jgi:hypothetical protein
LARRTSDACAACTNRVWSTNGNSGAGRRYAALDPAHPAAGELRDLLLFVAEAYPGYSMPPYHVDNASGGSVPVRHGRLRDVRYTFGEPTRTWTLLMVVSSRFGRRSPNFADRAAPDEGSSHEEPRDVPRLRAALGQEAGPRPRSQLRRGRSAYAARRAGARGPGQGDAAVADRRGTTRERPASAYARRPLDAPEAGTLEVVDAPKRVRQSRSRPSKRLHVLPPGVLPVRPSALRHLTASRSHREIHDATLSSGLSRDSFAEAADERTQAHHGISTRSSGSAR